jgi:hypothetical protein
VKNCCNFSTALIDRANVTVYITLTVTTGGQNQESQKSSKPHLDAQHTADIQKEPQLKSITVIKFPSTG